MADLNGKTPLDSASEPSASACLSRRRVFQTLIGSAAGLSAAIALMEAEAAQAQSKTPKKVAKYQDHPKNGQQCSECRFFRPPKACQLVAGDISPDGWCSFYAPKPS